MSSHHRTRPLICQEMNWTLWKLPEIIFIIGIMWYKCIHNSISQHALVRDSVTEHAIFSNITAYMFLILGARLHTSIHDYFESIGITRDFNFFTDTLVVTHTVVNGSIPWYMKVQKFNLNVYQERAVTSQSVEVDFFLYVREYTAFLWKGTSAFSHTICKFPVYNTVCK